MDNVQEDEFYKIPIDLNPNKVYSKKVKQFKHFISCFIPNKNQKEETTTEDTPVENRCLRR